MSKFAGEATKELAKYIGSAMEEIAELEFKGIRTRLAKDGRDYYAMHRGLKILLKSITFPI